MAQILNKASGDVTTIDGRVIDLSEPSIVQLHIGPEEVQSFQRQGMDLKLALLNGNVVTIEGFFVVTDAGERSDLVLIDDDGVAWWGQYPEQWTEFYFTEIEDDMAAIPPWLWAGLGILGLGAAAAAIGGGGGGDGDSNNPPVASPDTNGGPEGAPVTGDLLNNDSDPDGDPLTVTEFSVDTDGDGTPEIFEPGETAHIPNVGDITVNEDGSYTFTPEENFNGEVPPVHYTTTDGNGGDDDSKLNITVEPTDDAPTTTDDTNSGPEDQPISGNVLDNDDSPDGGKTVTGFEVDTNGDGQIDPSEHFEPGDTVTLVTESGDPIGTLQIKTDGSYTFDPAPDFHGDVPPVTYTIVDGDGDPAPTPGELTLTVTPVDDPLAITDVPQNLTVDESALPQGTDPGTGDDAVDGQFSVSAQDGLDTVTIAGATFTLGQLGGATPANPLVVTTDHGELRITGYTDTSNGGDTSGDIKFTYELTDPADHGNGAVNENIAVTVTDVDGDTTNNSIAVEIIDDAPVAFDDADDVISTQGNPDNPNPSSEASGNVITGTDVTGNPDPNTSDGKVDTAGADGIDVTGVVAGNTGSSFTGDNLGQQVVGEYGTLVLNSDGSYRYVPDYSDSTVSGLGPNDTVTDTFTYQITDGDGDTDTATLDINIYGTPAVISLDNGDVANTDGSVYESDLSTGTDPTDTQEVLQDSFLLVPGQHGLQDSGTALEISVNGTSQTFTKADIEAFDTTQPALIQGKYGAFQITGYDPATGKITYTYTLTDTADQSASGINEELTLEMWDGTGNSTGDQPLNIAIIDDKPAAATDSGDVTEGATLTVDAINGVLGNDQSGADGWDSGGAVVGVVSGDSGITSQGGVGTSISGAYGTLTLNPDGSYTYESTANEISADTKDVFTYTVKDSDGDLVETTLTINVADVTGTPTTTTGAVDEAGLSNGTDASGNSETVDGNLNLDSGWSAQASNGTASHGTFTVNADGTYSYTLTDSTIGDNTTDSFTYTAEDANGNTVENTVTINITDDVPVAAADNGDVAEGATLDVDAANGVLSNDQSGADGWDGTGAVVGVVVGDSGTTAENGNVGTNITGTYGILTLNADGSYTYESTANEISADAKDVFTYTVKDSDGDLVETTLTINVADVTGTPTTTTGAVDEAGLSNGTDASSDSETVDGNLNLDSGWSAQASNGTASHGTFTVNADGTYSYTLTEPTAGDTTDSFTYTAEDANGNTVTNTVTIDITDDVPVITTTSDGTPPTVTVQDVETLNGGISTASQDFSNVFGDTPTYGADGAGSVGWGYDLGLQGGGSSVASGLASGGDAITLFEVNGEIVGSTATSAGAIDASNTAFTIAVDASGKVTLSQSLPIDHADPANAGETIALVGGLVTLTGTATITDDDGDTASDSTTVDIGDSFVFTDDGPAIGTPANGAVDEANLPSGSDPGAPVEASGTLGVTPSGDTGDTVFTDDTTDPDSTNSTISYLEGLALTSNGSALDYAISNNGHTLTATNSATGDAVFTVDITSPGTSSAGYEFTLNGPLDHGTDSNLAIEFSFSAIDGDGDSDSDTFTVTVTDDSQGTNISESVNEDDSVTFNTTADGTPDNIEIYQGGNKLTDNTSDGVTNYKTEHGTVTVKPDGSITYTPDGDYSGRDDFEYNVNNGDSNPHTSVTMTVNPISDAPDLNGSDAGLEDNHAVSTDEDTAVALGLTAPVNTDAIDQNGTDPVTGAGDNRERIGLITLSGLPEGAVLSDGSGYSVIVGATGEVTIRLAGVWIEANANGEDLTLTSAGYESLQVTPPEDSGDNFTVDVSVTSYEVDASGVKLPGVPGATTTGSVEVDVKAVTDTPELGLQQPTNAGDVGAESLTVSGSTITAAINEDATLDLQTVLQEQLNDEAPGADGDDTDGSESMWYTISGLPEGTQVTIGGVTYTADASGSIDTGANKITIGSATVDPDFTITPPADYSNSTPINATITLNVQDNDSDSPSASPSVEKVSVNLNLSVNPVAGDVTVGDVETAEDTAVNFLSGVEVTDTGTGSSGTEVIDSVSFKVPSGWTMTAPADTADFDVTTDPSGNTIITFTNGLDESVREGILDDFTITPPGHSSADATISVDVKTTDSNGSGSDTTTTTDNLKITVTPQAEIIATPESDTDGDGNADLTMHGDHNYTTAGAEDTWFDLNSDGADLISGWSNQDSDASNEQTFARLTPELVAGDGSLADAIGSQFRWSTDSGSTWEVRTYNGGPIDVPIAYLDTLQFKAAPDFSGQFKIKVQAYTVDTDPDGGTPSTALSGEAELTNVLIKPAADDVTLALSGHASGNEDADIPLTIQPSSSDPSETFNVTIGNIPDGSIITYGGNELTVTNGSVTITDFDPTTSLTIKPPHNSNDDFTLKVSADSVDKLDTGTNSYEDTSTTGPLDIDVDVKGVADDAHITPTAQTYSEANLDAGSTTVNLSDLATVALTDADTSETLTMRVTGLPEGFAPSAGTLLDANATGSDRVWVLTQTQFDSATISVPDNYSGTVDFTVAAVTTENDGDSLTDATGTNVSFTVTPSPEAMATTSDSVVEDEISQIDLSIVHQNGDTDETLTAVRIDVDYATGQDFTLYLDDGTGLPQTLADALSSGAISTVTDGGTTYYVLDATQAGHLAAQGGANLDGTLGSFDFQYQITDDAYGNTSAGNTTTSAWQNGTFTLDATAVTDAPDASITAIDAGSGTAADNVTGDDASPDTVTLSQADTVSVTLHVDSPDTDGSEHLTRIVINGVPDGVTVVGGQYIGSGQWLLVYEGNDAKSIDTSGLTVPVEFNVSGATADGDHDITMTAQVQDNGNETAPGTGIEKDSVTWHLDTSFGGNGSGEDPATIEDWTYNGFDATEDGTFQLSDMLTGQVSNVNASVNNVFTITLENLPAGTVVGGTGSVVITHSVIDGHDVYTASTTVSGSEDANVELDDLMNNITITPPPNSNDNNNAADPFNVDATLTTSVPGGDSESKTVTPTVPVLPLTDPAVIDVQLDTDASGGDTSVETDQLDTADSTIPLTITVDNSVDGPHGTIIGGKLYLQITSTEGDLASGTLTGDGTHGVSQVTYDAGNPAPSGLSNGTYYVIDNISQGDTLDLVYTPTDMVPGDVTVNAWVQNQESGSSVIELANGSTILTVGLGNDGVMVTSDDPIGGDEAVDNNSSSYIELSGLNVQLNDTTTTDGSTESIQSVSLSGVPNGFLVYVGSSAATATLAHNAGDHGSGNTWVLANGDLAGNVYILPPQHWSGTLSGLEVVMQSGESGLTESRVDTHNLAHVTVNPVADGIDITPTNTFGQEGEIIPLHLNASMADATQVNSTDTSTETTTLKISGLGEHASFYLENALIAAGKVSYDAAGDGTYTITGLSQSDLHSLGFKQANAAITDQDSASGVQLGVEAWTEESAGGADSAHDNSTITLNMSEQTPTAGDDTLIWTGEAIDGLGGVDTVQLRQGESLSGADLVGFLDNVEQIDLGIPGANDIGSSSDGLTAQDVADILGSGPGDTLTLLGDADDTVYLDSSWIDNGNGTWTGTVSATETVTLSVLDDDHLSGGSDAPHVV